MNSDFGVFDTFWIDEEAEVWAIKEDETGWQLHKKDSTGWRLVCIIPPEVLADMEAKFREDHQWQA